jgi:hypothetical protein
MSGTYITTATRASPSVAYYAAAGSGGGATSTFQTASVSSLNASTITTGSLIATQVQSAIDQSALFYTSSLSGVSNTGTSTLLFSVGGGGTYTANLNLVTSAVNSVPITTIFTVGLSGNSTVAAVNPLADNSSATYDVTAFASSSVVNVYLANTGGISPGYVGSYTRIGF